MGIVADISEGCVPAQKAVPKTGLRRKMCGKIVLYLLGGINALVLVEEADDNPVVCLLVRKEADKVSSCSRKDAVSGR